MHDFILPLFLPRFQQVGSYFPHPALQGTNLQGLIASGGAALQLPEDVATAPFGIGRQPGKDLLPLSLKGVFVGAPPAQHAFSPLLLAVQGLESCWWSGSIPLFRKISRCTLFCRKDVERVGKGE
jgi:hypothetical protein